ncbi:hypothetical protein [Niveibacterium sp. SC-1]|uniref:hypothetical protein n=1 Tax=Niveibacterium sp. SC-1 TaxID=3135646 RepID=UPI00312047FC
MPLQRRRAALVAALCNLPPYMRNRLVQLKDEGNNLRQRPDLLWFLLIRSSATHGQSSGWERLAANPQALAALSHVALSALQPADLQPHILAALRSVGIRMQTLKAPRLAANFGRVMQLGGVVAATARMLALPAHREKYLFITQFDGIGQKYGRNIWMDLYDPSFRNTIAVDARVLEIAAAVGLQSTTYRNVESFFCSIAQDSGLEPWEVDRLLYNYKDYFLRVIADAS